MESLTIFIPVTLLILSYSILLFPSYLITIYNPQNEMFVISQTK